MIGFYNYTVILTYISLLTSVQGIYWAVDGRLLPAMLCLLASGVCDMFDGMIARTRKNSTKEEKSFGIQLDSLCDIVCFGVLPAAVGMGLTLPVTAGERSLPLTIAAGVAGGLFVLCALIRLAYFNVTEEARQATEGGNRKSYMGVPVTTVAVVFPLVYALDLFLPTGMMPWLYAAMLFVCAVAFILPVKVPKPRLAGKCVMGVIGCGEIGLLLYQLLR